METSQRDGAQLREENAELKRQLASLQSAHAVPSTIWRPSPVTIWSIVLGLAALFVIGFLAGYIPLTKRNALLKTEAAETRDARPRVETMLVSRSGQATELQLPGSIQAITEAPILARANGYILKRTVDIGDRVRAGQTMAEIEAPELDQQVVEAKATLQLSQATLEQAQANYEQGKSSLQLAQTTAQRWSSLATRGVVSKQENDQFQTQYQSQLSSVRSLEKAINAQKSGIAVSEANLARLQRMQEYLVVKAPFDGIVTQRNVDVGALVNAGNTVLYRVAQMDMLRIYVNVPQANASFIHQGQRARLSVPNLPGREFTGTVVRTSNSLDPSSRTMLVEVQISNTRGELLPGMYARVNLNSNRTDAPILVPSDVLIVRPDGTQVAVLGPDNVVHLRPIEIGRDYGDKLEIVKGVSEGDRLIPNPGDNAREGLKVNPER